MGMKKYEALVSKVFYFLLSTAILAMLGVFGFIFSTIPLPKNHTTVVATAYELVVMARSTRMHVFILFHIIIVMICYGSSSKPPFESKLDSDDILVVNPKVHALGQKDEEEGCAYSDDKCDECVSEFLTDEEGNNDASYDGDDEYDEEGHGDLRGRIEEFIGSVTGTWKEELLKEKKLLCLVEHTESLYMLVPHTMV